MSGRDQTMMKTPKNTLKPAFLNHHRLAQHLLLHQRRQPAMEKLARQGRPAQGCGPSQGIAGLARRLPALI